MKKNDERPAIIKRANVSYEPRDVNARTLLAVGISILVAAVVISFVVLFVFDYFAARDERRGVQPSTLVRREGVRQPPEPRLQTDPAGDLLKMRAEESNALNSYGWIDRQKGVVRIPIERAIELVVERGLPPSVQTGTGAQGNAGALPDVTQESKRQPPANSNSRRSVGEQQP